MREIKGRHVLFGFVGAFGVIIGANLTLAFNAVSTFPGLEVKNSYEASQVFDRNKKAHHVKADVTPDFLYQGGVHVARVPATPGNWNLRMKAVADDGTVFQQRIPLYVPS